MGTGRGRSILTALVLAFVALPAPSFLTAAPAAAAAAADQDHAAGRLDHARRARPTGVVTRRLPDFARRQARRGRLLVRLRGTQPPSGPASLAEKNYEGHGGYTIQRIRDNIFTYLAKAPDVVLLMIGTNDMGSLQNLSSGPSRLEHYDHDHPRQQRSPRHRRQDHALEEREARPAGREMRCRRDLQVRLLLATAERDRQLQQTRFPGSSHDTRRGLDGQHVHRLLEGQDAGMARRREPPERHGVQPDRQPLVPRAQAGARLAAHRHRAGRTHGRQCRRRQRGGDRELHPPANDGGSPITGYSITSSPGGVTKLASGSGFVFDGLTNGTVYTFRVRAANVVGLGPQSSASSPVTPTGGQPHRARPRSGPHSPGTGGRPSASPPERTAAAPPSR